MILRKKTTVLAIYILLSFSSPYANANFPSIRPVPCTNQLSGESGICTFNWSCVNVAHGVHIGPCVDRFFVGTCCKVPQGATQDDGQATAEEGEVHPRTPLYHSVAPEIQEEEIRPATTVAYDNGSPSSEIDSRLQQPNFGNYSSPSIHNKIPLTTSLHNLFPSSSKKSVLDQTTPASTFNRFTDFHMRSTVSGLSFQHKPVLDHDARVPVIVESSHNMRNPVISHHTFNYRQPVKNHEQHDLRKPVPLDEAHDIRWPVLEEDSHDQRFPGQAGNTNHFRKPVPLDEAHDQRWPVLEEDSHDQRLPDLQEQSDLRKPVPLDEAHDLRWPVLEEDSHDQRLPVLQVPTHELHKPIPDQTAKPIVVEEDLPPKRLPVVHLFEWLGKWYLSLNNHKKNNGSNNFYSLTTTQTYKPTTSILTTATQKVKPTTSILTTEKFEPTTSTLTTLPFQMTTEPIPTEESFDSTTGTLVTAAHSTAENVDNTISTTSNFTLFIRPSSPPSSVPIIQVTPDTVEYASHNVSQVCGRSRTGGTMARIVGGRKSRYLRWPWMISLRRYEDETFKHKCGATLLNEYWAITAAHCVEGKLPSELLLRLGEHNFRRADELHPHVERRVSVMATHPGFDPVTYENDLALLRFDTPVRLRANIAPVCLPDTPGQDITGRMAVVTGWGRLAEAGELPASLHEVQMPIISNQECEQMYFEAGYAEHIRDVFVCAGLSSGGLDACEGDSGGPMVLRGDAGQWTLVGLISWGMGCAAPKQPGVYTRISHFTHWIEAIIKH